MVVFLWFVSYHASFQMGEEKQPLLRGTPHFVWSVNDIMGQGATAAVYKGRHKRTGDMIAVKMFNKNASRVPPSPKGEFDILSKLNHQNIVRLLAVEEESQHGSEVLIMELCTHGSLYHILDQPENSHGLEEGEYLRLLSDVAGGMQHLREQGVIHRDIKPGNIMKYEDFEQGTYIYKLIDFGAARELDDEGEFTSLYGTEEYLHPDLYQRAVLRRPMSKRRFGVGVDLWSLGVTLYHAATGELPFRPFGGRKNREMMHRITTTKASGVISGVQESDLAPIQWARELPDACPFSKGFRSIITPILAGLMECHTQRMFTFPEFFDAVKNINNKRLIHVFNTCTSSVLHVYVEESAAFGPVQEEIKKQSQILPSDQELLYHNMMLNPYYITSDTPAINYPRTTDTNPIFLFCDPRKLPPLASQLIEPIVPKFPDIQVTCVVEDDVPLAKNCAAIIACIKRYVKDVISRQHLLIESAMTYWIHFGDEIRRSGEMANQLFEKVEETGKRVEYVCQSSARTLDILHGTQHRIECTMQSNDSMKLADSVTNLQQHATQVPYMFQTLVTNAGEIQYKLHAYFPGQIKDKELTNTWKQNQGCTDPDKCINKIDYLLRETKRTTDDFRRDRALKTLSYNEEQIHKFEKSKLAVNGTKAVSIFQGDCFANTKKVYHKCKHWFRDVFELKRDFNGVKLSINEVVEIHNTVTQSLNHDQEYQNNQVDHVMQQIRHTPSTTTSIGAGHVHQAPLDYDSVSSNLMGMSSHVIDTTNLPAMEECGHSDSNTKDVTMITDDRCRESLDALIKTIRETKHIAKKLLEDTTKNGKELEELELSRLGHGH